VERTQQTDDYPIIIGILGETESATFMGENSPIQQLISIDHSNSVRIKPTTLKDHKERKYSSIEVSKRDLGRQPDEEQQHGSKSMVTLPSLPTNANSKQSLLTHGELLSSPHLKRPQRYGTRFAAVSNSVTYIEGGETVETPSIRVADDAGRRDPYFSRNKIVDDARRSISSLNLSSVDSRERKFMSNPSSQKQLLQNFSSVSLLNKALLFKNSD